MKRINLIIALMACFQVLLAQESSFKIDTKASTIVWHAKKVVGGHTGTVAIKDGSIKTENNKIIGGEFSIDMYSIACTDAPKVTNDLRGENFFNVSKHPTAKFVITNVDNSTSTPIISGNLTVRGKTKNISFPAKVTSISDKGVSAEARDVKINRLDFDIKYRSATFFGDLGDRAIENEFTLDINIKGVK